MAAGPLNGSQKFTSAFGKHWNLMPRETQCIDTRMVEMFHSQTDPET